jgi:hypothetical protein
MSLNRPINELSRVFRHFNRFYLCIVLAFTPVFALAQPDLMVSVTNESAGAAFVGSEVSLRFKISNNGTSPTNLSPGDVVLRANLSPLAAYDPPFLSTLFLGAFLDCALLENVMTCTVSSQNFSVGGSTTIVVTGIMETTGTWQLPPTDGSCRVDPDDIVDESDDTNNDCTVDIPTVEVQEAPAFDVARLMGVAMWHNVAMVHDLAKGDFVNAAPISEIDGTPLHALNDIVLDPASEKIYVFHRRYQSNKQRLGIFDPATGVTDIGDTGNSFHDSTFSTDGKLYAVGRDATLYRIDTATASPTPLCDTSLGSDGSNHTALAWDPNTQELLQIYDDQLIALDLENLPSDPGDPCPSSITQVGPVLPELIFAAEYIDGNLIVVGDDEGIYLVARNGAVLGYGDVPATFHGVIADPGTLPAPAPKCPADALVSQSSDSNDSMLFAVDLESRSLDFLFTAPTSANSMDMDPRTGDLIVEGWTTFYRLNACSGEIISEFAMDGGPGSFFAMDITLGNGAFGFYRTDGLYSFDLETGLAQIVGTSQAPSANAMAITGGQVVFEVNNGNVTESIASYELATYPAVVVTTPLDYGGLEVGQYLDLQSLDVRFTDGQLFGVLRRVRKDSSINVTNALPNALVRIDGDGKVTHLLDLPAGADSVSINTNPVFSNGFESPPE